MQTKRNRGVRWLRWLSSPVRIVSWLPEPPQKLGDSPNREAPHGHDYRSDEGHLLAVLIPVIWNYRGGPRGIRENKNAPSGENRDDDTHEAPPFDQPARTQREKQPCD